MLKDDLIMAVKLCCPVETQKMSHTESKKRGISGRNRNKNKPLSWCQVVTANNLYTWAENAVQELISLIWIFTSCLCQPRLSVVPVYLDKIMTPVLITRRLNATDCDRVSSLKCFVCLLVLFSIFLFSLVKKYKYSRICNVLNMRPSTQGRCEDYVMLPWP